jgi:hypothetical protein
VLGDAIGKLPLARANLIVVLLVPTEGTWSDCNRIGQSTPVIGKTVVKLEYVPLFQVQRELQGMPRNYQRFRQYLRVIKSPDGRRQKLPSLIAMNPMGKEHVTDLLDALRLKPVCARALGPAPPAPHAVSLSGTALPGGGNRYRYVQWMICRCRTTARLRVSVGTITMGRGLQAKSESRLRPAKVLAA